MKIVNITACIRITKENERYGMESYIDVGSKVKITFKDRKTLVGYLQRIDYGHYPGESELLVLKTDDNTFIGAMPRYIADIEVLSNRKSRDAAADCVATAPRFSMGAGKGVTQ